MVTAAPSQVRVRMYNVGFGDCFLLTFAYANPIASGLDPDNERSERHILFDFGSTRRARSRVTLLRLAKQIAIDCGGRLDAIVVSHRHSDHLSGFKSKGTVEIIKGLTPKLVVRSWTENPRLKANSGVPPTSNDLALAGNAGSDDGYLSALRAGQDLADKIVRRAESTKHLGTNVAEVAETELTNSEAVATLNELSRGGRGEYLNAGQETRLNDVAPGVDFQVLGPPKPSQWPDVSRQADDSEEFWLKSERQINRLFTPTTASNASVPIGSAQWIISRLRNDDQKQVAALVRWLDDALNNTSVVLLITVGKLRLLFGGDAQIENWGWALKEMEDKKSALRKAVRDVDLYKVGHHGSRNATPKSLYEIWQERDVSKRPLLSMMSTKANVHGHDDHAVPRTTLIDALRELGTVESTDDGLNDWIEAKADLPSGPFQVTRAPL